LSSIKFGPILIETQLLANTGEHFSSAVELHDEEYFLLGLEGVLDIHEKWMID